MNVCPLEPFPSAQPTFLTFRHTTYFSVPSKMTIMVSCSETSGAYAENKIINNYGAFEIPKGCDVNINNEYKIRPSFVAKTIVYQFDSVLAILPVDKRLPNYSFPTTPIPTQMYTSQMTLREIGNFGDGVGIVFSHETAVGEIIRVSIYLAGVAVIFAILYFSIKPFRLWVNGCCFCTKPTVFFRDVKGYANVPEFSRKKKDAPQPPQPPSVGLTYQQQALQAITGNLTNVNDSLKRFYKPKKEHDISAPKPKENPCAPPDEDEIVQPKPRKAPKRPTQPPPPIPQYQLTSFQRMHNQANPSNFVV